MAKCVAVLGLLVVILEIFAAHLAGVTARKDVLVVSLDVDCTAAGGGKSTGHDQAFVDTMMARTNYIYQECTQNDSSAILTYDTVVSLTMPCLSNITIRGQVLSCSWLALSRGSRVNNVASCADAFVNQQLSQDRWINYYNHVILLPFGIESAGYSYTQKSNLTAATYPYYIHMSNGSDARGTGDYLTHELGHGRYGLDHSHNETADFDILARSYPGPGTYWTNADYGDNQDLMGLGKVDGCFGAVHADHLGWSQETNVGFYPMGNITSATDPETAGCLTCGWRMYWTDNSRLAYLTYYSFTALDKTHRYFIGFRVMIPTYTTNANVINSNLIPQMRNVLMLHRGNIMTQSTDISTSVILKVFRAVNDTYISPAGDFTVVYNGQFGNGLDFTTIVPRTY